MPEQPVITRSADRLEDAERVLTNVRDTMDIEKDAHIETLQQRVIAMVLLDIAFTLRDIRDTQQRIWEDGRR